MGAGGGVASTDVGRGKGLMLLLGKSASFHASATTAHTLAPVLTSSFVCTRLVCVCVCASARVPAMGWCLPVLLFFFTLNRKKRGW